MKGCLKAMLLQLLRANSDPCKTTHYSSLQESVDFGTLKKFVLFMGAC